MWGEAGFGSCPARGVIKGAVVDYKEASACTHSALQAAEAGAGAPVDAVYLAQTGAHLEGFYHEASVNVNAADNCVGALDIDTTDLTLANATDKLVTKRLDLIVGNDISQPDAGFEVDTNRAVIVDAEGGTQQVPLQSKSELAGVILDRVAALLRQKRSE